MGRPQEIRAALRKLNWFLAVVVVLSAFYCWSSSQETGQRAPIPAASVERVVEDVAADPAPKNELLDLVLAFHGSSRPASPATEQTAEPTELPLRAFRVALLLHSGDDPAYVLLKPKDKSRSLTYVLTEGKTGGKATLDRVTYRNGVAFCSVSRGSERFTFEYPLASRRPAVAVRPYRGERPETPGSSRSVAYARGRTLVNLSPPGLKGVPFYADDGRVVGFRVSGVRPGSRYRDLGVLPGDVISSVNETRIRDVRSFREQLVTGLDAMSITLRRGEGRNAKRVVLSDS